MGDTLGLVDWSVKRLKKRATARPRFKNRTWSTLHVGSTKSEEKAYLPGPIAHPPRQLVSV
jgi:hypothetical protein